MKAEETIDFHIKWAWHKIAKFYNSKAAKYDTTMATGNVLLNIDLEKGTPATSLGPKMGMEPRSLSRIIKTLEDKKLIIRKPDNDDKRINRIWLTNMGLEKRELAKSIVIEFNQKIQSSIPREDLLAFFKTMNLINEINFNGESNE